MTKSNAARRTAAIAIKLACAFALAFSITLSGVATTGAEARPIPRYVKNKCKRDYKRFCPRYKVGSRRLDRCIESKIRRVSCRCVRAMVRKGLAPRKALRKRRYC